MGGAISAAVARVPGRGQPGRAGRLAVHAGLIALVVALSAAGSRPTLRPAVFRLLGGRSATLGAAPPLCGAVLSQLRGAVAVPCRAVGGARSRQHGGAVAPLGAGLSEGDAAVGGAGPQVRAVSAAWHGGTGGRADRRLRHRRDHCGRPGPPRPRGAESAPRRAPVARDGRGILRVGLVAPLTAVQSVIMAAARTGGAA